MVQLGQLGQLGQLEQLEQLAQLAELLIVLPEGAETYRWISWVLLRTGQCGPGCRIPNRGGGTAMMRRHT